MSKTLIVIFGAGASYDCHEAYQDVLNESPRLPLTNQLFDLPVFEPYVTSEVLRRYPGADFIGHKFLSKDAAVRGTLEDFLGTQLALNEKHTTMNVRQVPFFLRSLISRYSFAVKKQLRVTDYHFLIDRLNHSDFDNIALITLNYDMLLDNALSSVVHWYGDNFQSYIGHEKKWNYVKLHGCCNWIRTIRRSDLRREYGDGALRGMDFFTGLENDSWILKQPMGFINSEETPDYNQNDSAFFLPVMVIPYGKEKKHICPEFHISSIRPILGQASEVWICGNSMQDEDIKSLMRENATNVGSVVVIDKLPDQNPAEWEMNHNQHIKNAFPRKKRQVRFSRGFNDFVSKICNNAEWDLKKMDKWGAVLTGDFT